MCGPLSSSACRATESETAPATPHQADGSTHSLPPPVAAWYPRGGLLVPSRVEGPREPSHQSPAEPLTRVSSACIPARYSPTYRALDWDRSQSVRKVPEKGLLRYIRSADSDARTSCLLHRSMELDAVEANSRYSRSVENLLIRMHAWNQSFAHAVGSWIRAPSAMLHSSLRSFISAL